MLITFFIACGADSLLYKERAIRAMDVHLHVGIWNQIPDETQTDLATRFPFPFGLEPESLTDQVLTGEGIINELDKAYLDSGFMFAVYAPRSVGVATNEYVISQLKTNPERLFGMASLQVDDWENQRDVQLDALAMALEEPGMIASEYVAFDEVELVLPVLPLELDTQQDQGLEQIFVGRLDRANPDLYRLLSAEDQVLCLVRGRMEQLETLVDRWVGIEGLVYFIKASALPVLQPNRIVIDPLVVD